MPQFNPSPERASLGFEDAVLENFQFLNGLGFRPVKQEVTLVRYESAAAFVSVYHGRASYELGVEIGILGEPAEQVSLYEIVAWAGALEAEGFGQHVVFQVSSREGVQEFVPKLAELVRRYGGPFLRANPVAYKEALQARSREASRYEREVQLEHLRTRAEIAWRSKDFAGVVEVYGLIGSDMTPVEAKKLAYAEKQVRAGNDGPMR